MPENQKTDLFLFTGILIVLVIVLGALSLSVIFSKQPESFSQVFLDQETIPSSVVMGEDFSFNFFIENNENKVQGYSYEIWIESIKQKSGNISLQIDERQMISETAMFTGNHSDKQKVLLRIYKENSLEPYSLWFWVSVS